MTNRELIDIAYKAMENAYSPYSHFKVGAALLCENGDVYTGCNIENASYGATICAERTAISKAVSGGEQKFVKIAIAGSNNKQTMPCGICRQVLFEFMKDGTVITDNEGSVTEYTVEELLPGGFTLENN